MSRILRYLILAALGGFIAWAIAEPIDPLTPYVAPGATPPDMGAVQMALLGALFGFFLGTSLGIAEALSGVSPRDALKAVLVGATFGVFGGALGLLLGNILIYMPLHSIVVRHFSPGPSATGFVLELIGRTGGWALIGAVTGLAQGISTASTKKMTNGTIGGLLGGAAGGFIFQVFHFLLMRPEMLRMIGFTITASAVGLFIGFIEEVTKRAWLIRLVGRNEGKEYQIYKRETYVGRDELAEIPIFNDPDVQPRHFVIRADAHRHVVYDLNTTAGTMVNGQKVQQQSLRDGDVIQIGMTKLLFRDKSTRSLVPRAVDLYGSPGKGIPSSDRICPFCGGIKDAQGNCGCSIGADPTQNQTVQQPAGFPTQQMPQPVDGDPSYGTAAGPLTGQQTGIHKLIVISGPHVGQTFVLSTNGETTLGRQSDRDVSLVNDNTVSRQHARVVNEGGQFVLYDNDSANGTHVNNSRITRHVLVPGDFIQVGSTKLRYES